MAQTGHKIIPLLVALALSTSAASASLRVVDGDTIVLDGETVRILNIDTPELHHAQCDAERRLAVIAKKRVQDLLKGGQIALVRGDGHRMKDRHGRTLARVLVNGADIGDTLVADGLARPWEGKRRSWCN